MTRSAEAPEAGEITAMLRRVRQGEAVAFDRLVPLVYDSLKQISRKQLRRGGGGQTLCTTELVHEAYVKMARQEPPDWQDRAHFYGVAARAMRQVLVDHARRRQAGKRGGKREPITLTDGKGRVEMDIRELLALDEALGRLAARNERLRKVVELRFFAGMPEVEIAEVLQVSTRTVERDWTKARLFLHRELYPDAVSRRCRHDIVRPSDRLCAYRMD